jgi:hypothetical protein
MASISFSITLEEAVNNQLFIASESKRIRAKRRRMRFLYPSIWIAMAFLPFLARGHWEIISTIFVAAGVLMMVFYPLYEKGMYRRHYQRHLMEHAKKDFDEENPTMITLALGETHLEVETKGIQSQVEYSTLTSLIETKDVYYLRLDPPKAFILPKRVFDSPEGEAFFQGLQEKVELDQVDRTDWVWK